jgi:AGZA family xanthine/uracil permease-like MFS transporter
MVFFVLGPAFLHARFQLEMSELDAARHVWHIGIWAIVLSGLFKFACAFGCNLVRKLVPRAGLLGSLTAIALVLISFLPLLDIFHYPVVGFVALAIILTTLVARIRLPARIPGTLGALLVAGLIYYLMYATGTLGHKPPAPGFAPHEALLPHEWLSAFRFAWVLDLQHAVKYLPIVIPFALATVVGGIDCVESAAAAGDEFDTNQVIGVEAVATLFAGLSGGVIQTTPYIGHPAYKAMGGRAAYALATALFVGGAGLIGYFGYLYLIIPKATVFPILVFIGLEISAQSFRATPKQHYPAVTLACLPALAALVLLFTDNLQGQYMVRANALHERISEYRELVDSPPPGSPQRSAWDAVEQEAKELQDMTQDHGVQFGDEPIEPLREQLARNLQTLRILAGGFIITSLIWASALAALIDRRLRLAATWFAVAAACALFGIIHSPLPGSPLVNPLQLPENLPGMAAGQTPVYLAAAYLAASALLLAWNWLTAGNDTNDDLPATKEPQS